MKNLWKHWPEVRERFIHRKKILLLLDFDGTLSPLVKNPNKAKLPRRLRTSLRELRDMPRVRVAIMSGRPLSYLKSEIGLRRVHYGSNHGLEITGPALSFRHSAAAAARPLLQRLARRVKRALRSVPGSHLEDKGLTLSLHYRAVPAPHRKAFFGILRRAKSRTAGLPLLWTSGRKVWELRPKLLWDKGKAGLHLVRRLGNPFPIVIGDDRTDEDMFASLRERGLAIRVGRGKGSAAEFYLRRQTDVLRFLNAVRRDLSARREP
ncbi:MAG TPA: trehalose-phosphatase [Elusimicrobiota bacterium]|nr:trehalose-phosphatase [Elusimicrobiota bacterium]